MKKTICYFVGTHGDWGGASRILFNLVRRIDRERFQPIVMLSQEGPICQELARLEVEFHIWPRHDFSNPLRFAHDVLAAMRFFKRRKVDLVHLNHGCIGWRPAELTAARMLGIPIVQHAQQPVAEPSPDLRQADLVLTCSDYLQTVCATGSIPKRTVYDLVDAQRFEAGRSIRPGIGIDDECVVFSFIGRTRRKKGLQMFVDLARKLDDPHARFLITGQRVGVKTDDSYSAEQIKSMVEGDARIIYLGYRADIEGIYASSDVVVMPSQADEPCPAVLIESAICGKPVIATRTGSTPEFVQHGQTGYLVERHDLEAMVEFSRSLITDASLRQRIGRAARAAAQERFVVQPIAVMQALYTELTR